jgi:hypothetical protein
LNDCHSSLSRDCDKLANDDLTNVINLAEDFGFSRLKPMVGATFGALQIELSRSERVLLDTAIPEPAGPVRLWPGTAK